MAGLRIVAGGDVAIGGVLAGLSAEELASRVQGVSALFAAGDLGVVSLDCAIGEQGEPPEPEEYVVDGPLANLAILEGLGIGLVTQANNHSTDRGLGALTEGRRELSRRGMRSVGAGGDEQSAREPMIFELGGMRLGFLAFASTEPWVGALGASAEGGGVAPLRNAETIAAVSRLATEVDAVVVGLHWGKEYIPLPPPESVRLGRALIDAGAGLVIGTHPHVVQPLETYNGGVICYSLGNLLFPPYPEQGLGFSGSGCQSLVVTFEVTADSTSVESLTVVSFDDDGFLSIVAEPDAGALLTELSKAGETLGSRQHKREWCMAVQRHEAARLCRVLREEVLAAGWRGGSARLLHLGRKNLSSVVRSLGEILWPRKGS